MVSKIDVRGVPHAYERTAPTHSSTALVFLHGWLLSRAYWQPIVERLAPEYQCLTYDLRGFGDSQTQTLSKQRKRPAVKRSLAIASTATTISFLSATPETDSTLDLAKPDDLAQESPSPLGFTPADYATDLSILLDQLQMENVWLVGHSLGGSIALWAADQMPEQVKGVICVNSGGGIYLKEEFERFRAAGEQLVKLRPRWLCYLPLIDLLMTWMNVAKPIPRQWGRQRLLDWVLADPDAALGALLESTTEVEVHQLPQVVSRLKQPVHFIAGANDMVMQPQYVRHLASFHPLFALCGNNVTEIPNCGHLAMLEQPEVLVAEIKRILNAEPQ